MIVIPELKRLHSPDVFNLEGFSPAEGEPFGILVQAMFGQKDLDGEESFDIIVCSPEWLVEKVGHGGLYSGRHHLICGEFNYRELVRYLNKKASECTGRDWIEVAAKLSRVGKWEFEDYS